MTDVLARVSELLPDLAKRSADIEQHRDLPADVIDLLAGAGCFRMLAPAGYGGADLPMTEMLPVITELARADASAAWVVGQVALAQLIVRCCPEPAVAEVFADGPDTLMAGAVAPKGRATEAGDSWHITGQWPFVTGCRHARWFYLNCVTVSGRTVQTTASGAPATRILLLPAAEVTLLDTWFVLGLRGTGSHDVLVTRAACPAERGFTLREGDPMSQRAAADIAQSSLIIAAVAVGVAAGALDDVVALAAGGKRPAFSPTRLAASTVFADRLGEAALALRAARALLAEVAGEAGARAGSAQVISPAQRAQTRAAAATITATARNVVDTAYTLSGGTAVYDTAPIQRRLRDLHTATQHFVAGRDAYRVVGATLVGEPVDTGPF